METRGGMVSALKVAFEMYLQAEEGRAFEYDQPGDGGVGDNCGKHEYLTDMVDRIGYSDEVARLLRRLETGADGLTAEKRQLSGELLAVVRDRDQAVTDREHSALAYLRLMHRHENFVYRSFDSRS